MAWLESHQGLARHIKTKRLSRRLNVSVPAIIGHLHLLWWWAMDNLPDGCLSLLEPEDIADEMMWEGDAKELLSALIEVGFIDEINDQLFIHDWHDYIGKLLQSREKKSSRTSEMRRAYQDGTINMVKERDGDCCRYCGNEVDWTDRKTIKGGTYDHVDPNGASTFDNLVVACRSCNSKKGKRTPESARMALIPLNKIKRISSEISNDKSNDGSNDHLTTVPNSTVQYSTKYIDMLNDLKIDYKGIHGLEKVMSFVGVIDTDLIDLILKKSKGKSVAYFETIAENCMQNGITTAEQWKKVNKSQTESSRLDVINDL